jgi:hypothetical protein
MAGRKHNGMTAKQPQDTRGKGSLHMGKRNGE